MGVRTGATVTGNGPGSGSGEHHPPADNGWVIVVGLAGLAAAVAFSIRYREIATPCIAALLVVAAVLYTHHQHHKRKERRQ